MFYRKTVFGVRTEHVPTNSRYILHKQIFCSNIDRKSAGFAENRTRYRVAYTYMCVYFRRHLAHWFFPQNHRCV